jgi:hypothetical protein
MSNKTRKKNQAKNNKTGIRKSEGNSQSKPEKIQPAKK